MKGGGGWGGGKQDLEEQSASLAYEKIKGLDVLALRGSRRPAR